MNCLRSGKSSRTFPSAERITVSPIGVGSSTRTRVPETWIAPSAPPDLRGGSCVKWTFPSQPEERASPATGGGRTAGALEEERASPATGGGRTAGALEEERASPATGGGRTAGALEAERASPATGGGRTAGALEAERASPATGGGRTAGALEEERASPATGGGRTAGALEAAIRSAKSIDVRPSCHLANRNTLLYK